MMDAFDDDVEEEEWKRNEGGDNGSDRIIVRAPREKLLLDLRRTGLRMLPTATVSFSPSSKATVHVALHWSIGVHITPGYQSVPCIRT